jgi:hypothetical protein
MMAFSRAFIAGENLVAVTLVNSPTLTFLVLRACGTGLRAGKVSILHDFTWINLRDALLIIDTKERKSSDDFVRALGITQQEL